jgi:hypothetical protein
MLIFPKKKRKKSMGTKEEYFIAQHSIGVTTKVKAKSKLRSTFWKWLTKNKQVLAIIHNSKLTGWTMRMNNHNWSLKHHHLVTKQENKWHASHQLMIIRPQNSRTFIQFPQQQRLDTVVLFVNSPCLWALV